MTGVVVVGMAKSALPIETCKESGMKPALRRRPRVKSVESVERSHLCSAAVTTGTASVYSQNQSRMAMSQSVDFGKRGRNYKRNRGSTELSEFEDLENEDGHSLAVHSYTDDDVKESGSEYDSEAIDTFDELKSFGSGNVYADASSLRSIQSNSEFKNRFSFPRKSSYISKSKRPAAGGLAKLLRRSDTSNEEKVDAQDSLLEESTDVREQERHFGFRKCTHCYQIYACERGGEDAEDVRVPEDCKRNKYCSGECHLTHLSSLYEKQRRR